MPAGLLAIGRRIHLKNPAGSADRHIPFTASPVHQLRIWPSVTVFGGGHPATWPCQSSDPPQPSSACCSHLPAAQPAHLNRQKPIVLLLPIEMGCVADPSLAADLCNRMTIGSLLQNERLLRVRELLCFHHFPLLPATESHRGKL